MQMFFCWKAIPKDYSNFTKSSHVVPALLRVTNPCYQVVLEPQHCIMWPTSIPLTSTDWATALSLWPVGWPGLEIRISQIIILRNLNGGIWRWPLSQQWEPKVECCKESTFTHRVHPPYLAMVPGSCSLSHLK